MTLSRVCATFVFVRRFNGLFPSEELGQKFVVSNTLSYDMTKAATDLDLTASVHYGELCQQWTTWFQETE